MHFCLKKAILSTADDRNFIEFQFSEEKISLENLLVCSKTKISHTQLDSRKQATVF